MMKCKLCARNVTNQADGEYDDEDLDYEVLEANENGLSRNCLLWYQTNYDVNDLPARMISKGNNINSNIENSQ